jgi:hypothetical protein
MRTGAAPLSPLGPFVSPVMIVEGLLMRRTLIIRHKARSPSSPAVYLDASQV